MTAIDQRPVPVAGSGLLWDFTAAGVLESPDVQVAARLGRLGGERDESVLLAAALAVRAVRHGSVCLDLSAAEAATGLEDADEESAAVLAGLAWPGLDDWLAALRASPLVGQDPEPRPLRLVGGLLYLDRYWQQETVIATAVDDRRRRGGPAVDRDRLRAALDRLFDSGEPDRQRLAVAVAATRWVTVLAGGPGTGKTTTVAKLLAAVRDQPGVAARIALAAPTGKAAARLEEAVREAVATFGDELDRQRVGDVPATTLHRLLGWRPGARTRFRHDRSHHLPYDVVVVDEASMVSLTLMARLVEALREDTRLVLVGDPDQLASVEAGAVLGDLVQRPAPAGTPATSLREVVPVDLAALDEAEETRVRSTGVVTLTRVHRHDGEIKALAEAIQAGDPDAVIGVLASGGSVELVDVRDLEGVRRDVVEAGLALTDTAERGEAGAALAALSRHRLLCAHRRGPYGVAEWSAQVELWLREQRPDYGRGGLWYVGRPLLVAGNDRDLGLYNGDTGVVVRLDGVPRAVFPRADGVQAFPTNRLAEVTTVHAMSVHKSQGSQFDRVTLVLPEPGSPLLTRELFYTAVTRARQHVRVVGTADAVRAAVLRRIQRASGLATAARR